MRYLVKILEDELYKIINKTDSKHRPRGGNYIFVEGVDTNYPKLHTDEEGNLSVIEDEAPKLLQAAYDSMVSDVYDEMYLVFGTRNDVSAAAFASTYEAMIKRPANYVDVELGLADEDAVIAYATAKINDADAYGVKRLKRIGQFEAEKSAIMAGE